MPIDEVNAVKETTPKERVEIELRELKDKILKLSAVLYGDKLMGMDISTDMIRLMEHQLKAMQVYASILQNRLAIWDDWASHKSTFYHPIEGCNF